MPPAALCTVSATVRGLQRPRIPVPCVIASPTWTPWFYLMGTFNLKVLEFYCPLYCPWVQQAATLPNLYNGSCWSDFPIPGGPLFESLPVVLLLAGPPSILEYLSSEQLSRHHVLFWLEELLATPPGPLSFHLEVPHSLAGGVLDRSWTFYSNRPFRSAVPSPPRTPLQIIKRTVRGDRKVSRDCECHCLNDVALLPLSWIDHRLQCPTVYGKPGSTVVRHLTFGELMIAFDVPLPALPPNLLSVEADVGTLDMASFPFLAGPPLKVLHKVYESWGDQSYTLREEPVRRHDAWSLPDTMYGSGDTFQVEGAYRQAVKADDAAVPVQLWNDRVWNQVQTKEGALQRFQGLYPGRCPLDTIRGLLLTRWRIMVRRSLIRYLAKKHGSAWANSISPEATADITCGRDCLRKCTQADWWEWRGGSTLFFWRWAPEFCLVARDGLPINTYQDRLPHYRQPQRQENDGNIRTQVHAKLTNVMAKGYIATGPVLSLTSYFAVPKGDNDIRMVYDSTKSGLNSAIWVPTFSLPTVESLTDMLDGASWMSDLDMGEQFLNFPLDPALQPYCGIDVRPYLGAPEGNLTNWLRWTRCMMGLTSSPYVSVRGTHSAEELVFGDRMDPNNPFRWDHVHLNLPGSPSYTPLLPWVSKVRQDGIMAAGSTRFVDDLRPVGPSFEDCWQAAHAIATRFCYLGLQIASRKTRPPSQQPGAWAGTHALVLPDGIGVTCGLDKWVKAKFLLQQLQEELQQGPHISHKSLEQKRGFFVHLQRTYPCITPFLKGMHLTLDSWRPGRDAEGWKVSMTQVEMEAMTPIDDSAPEFVHAVPRLYDDLDCLGQLFQPSHPPIRFIRSTNIATVCYGFGDASGEGFGSCFLLSDGMTTFRHGSWGADAETVSSNYRELLNLVETLEEGVHLGDLHLSEVFIFTDNSSAEGCFYKGNSPSRTLFYLILRLRLLEMTGQLRLHMIHVAGSRMIDQGTDGLSRGDFASGVMAGQSMLSYIPLHEDAFQRHPPLLPWVRTWFPSPNITPLAPDDWYTLGHGWEADGRTQEGFWFPVTASTGSYLWSPAPAAASAAVDELSISRLKRPHLMHVFLCPRLMTHMWRKKLFKVADLVLELPPGCNAAWPASMHEPLLLAFVLPFLTFCPWELRNSAPLLELGGTVRRLWTSSEQSVGPFLRQLCELSSTLAGMSPGMVRTVLYPAPAG